MVGETVAEWPRTLRIVLSPFLLLWFGARVYFFPCVDVALRRIGRCCCRGCLRQLFCGVGLTFTDTSFPADDNSIGKELTAKFRQAGGSVEWKRADCLKPQGDDLFLFSNRVKAEDVKQGALADSGHCWLVPVMACLAGTMPRAINKIFVNKERSWRGRYRVRLYDIGRSGWRTITVDDIIPTRNGQPLFAKPNDKELWVVILEKAVAKFCGSYSAIAGGYEGWGLKTLTGNHVFTYRRLKPMHEDALGHWRRFEFSFKSSSGNKRNPEFEETDEVYESDDFWKILVNYARGRRSAICVNIARNGGDETRKDGLLESHVYSIVTAMEYGGEKLIQIRNCWGENGRWNGRWADSSSQSLGAPIIRVMQEADETGETFWMCWEDFRQIWTDITICSRSADVSDLALEIHEDLGCPGPCVGCLGGCFGYWCLCRGCKHVICPVKNY